jgi:mRNA interferase MazF
VYLVVSRREFVQTRHSTVICAPVYSTHHGLGSEVIVGEGEGLKRESSIRCDELMSVPKADMRHFVGSLGGAKMAEVDRALKVALALDDDD